jgi:hypothetical protein
MEAKWEANWSTEIHTQSYTDLCDITVLCSVHKCIILCSAV